MSENPGGQWFQQQGTGKFYQWSDSERCFIFQDGTRIRPQQAAAQPLPPSQSLQRTTNVSTTPRRPPLLIPAVQQYTRSGAANAGSSAASPPSTSYPLQSSTRPTVSSTPYVLASTTPSYPARTSSAPQASSTSSVPPLAYRTNVSSDTYGPSGNAVTGSERLLKTQSPSVAAARPVDPTLPIQIPNTRPSLGGLPPITSRTPSGSQARSASAISGSPYGSSPDGIYPRNTTSTSSSQGRSPSVDAITRTLQGTNIAAGQHAQASNSGFPLNTTLRPRHGQDSNGTQYISSYGPVEAITDPELMIGLGVRAHMRVQATAGEVERFDESYRVRKQPKKFFIAGKVFLCLWAEPAGPNSDAGTDITRDTRFSQPIHSKVRRFVVIRSADNHCSAIPIVSHGNQGAAKHGLKKSDFAVIYTGKTPPNIRPDEHPVNREEAPMRPLPVQVDPDERGAKLSSASRVNFGKVYTIEHNVKVKPWGMVNRDSMQALLYQFREVWTSSFGIPSGPVGPLAMPNQAAIPSAVPGTGASQAPQYTREQLRTIVEEAPRRMTTSRTVRDRDRSSRSVAPAPRTRRRRDRDERVDSDDEEGSPS